MILTQSQRPVNAYNSKKKSLSGEGLKVKKQKRPRCVITKSAETHDNNFSDGC